MKPQILILALAGLSGCASTVTMPDGSKMSESVYAHRLSVDAHRLSVDASIVVANKAATCDAEVNPPGMPAPTTELGKAIDALRAIGGLAVCTLRSTRGNVAPTVAQVPQYIAPPTFIDRVVQFAPIALGVGQLVASDRSSARQTQAGVDIARIGAARELGVVQAATNSNQAIASGGFNAVSTIASNGFGVIGQIAVAGSNAGVANSQAWANALASVPPTTQIIAGRDVIQARDLDQSFTAGDRINGSGNRLRNNVNCTATGGNGAPATAGNQSAAGGNSSAIGPPSPLTATYNPLISGGDGAAGSNNCGGG